MMTDGDTVLRAQAWDFFEIVAAQRLTVINFYIAIATLLSGGQLALLQTAQYASAAAGLGLLIAVLSFVFWKWDRRSSDLIKLAEDTLQYYETRIELADKSPESHVARLFTREKAFTQSKRMSHRWSVHHYFTYRICLNLLYCLFSVIGIGVAVLCLVR
jgi:hypothetical protein